MLTIDEELKRDALSQVHLLYGGEWYMVRYYKRMLMEKLTVPGDDMNCAVFQGEAAKTPDIADVGQLYGVPAGNPDSGKRFFQERQ